MRRILEWLNYYKIRGIAKKEMEIMKRLSMFLVTIVFPILCGASDSDMPSIKEMIRVSPIKPSFFIIEADKFQEDLLTRQEDSIYYTTMVIYNAIGL